MKRSEFLALVNGVIEEERKEVMKRFEETIDEKGVSLESLIRLFVDYQAQSVENAGIVAGKIIERLGLVPFEDD